MLIYVTDTHWTSHGTTAILSLILAPILSTFCTKHFVLLLTKEALQTAMNMLSQTKSNKNGTIVKGKVRNWVLLNGVKRMSELCKNK